jgi:glycosyltransferase involved in cell wall biosynthesis
MRIAQVATLATPVRERGAGSVEGLVWLLARELTRLGHQVTVFATAGSQVSGELVATLPGSYASNGSPNDWQLCEWINLCRAVEQSGRFDLLHSHNYLWGLPLEPLARAPMVHTLHVLPDDDQARLWEMRPGACVTAISKYQWQAFPALQPTEVIPHGLDATHFSFRSEPDDYVCFLGRFTPGKGPLAAIVAARSLGLRLLLAGPRNDYFQSRVEPLVDGRSVEYVGSVNGEARDRLLGGARALLYPLQEPEPFGLVMAEAMLCGTPVAATDLGAVREIVDHGLTGAVVPSTDELARAVEHAVQLDRCTIRERAVQRFSAERMAGDYARLYQQIAVGDSRRRSANSDEHSTAAEARIKEVKL